MTTRHVEGWRKVMRPVRAAALAAVLLLPARLSPQVPPDTGRVPPVPVPVPCASGTDTVAHPVTDSAPASVIIRPSPRRGRRTGTIGSDDAVGILLLLGTMAWVLWKLPHIPM